MIRYVTTNIFESPAQVIVNTVNTVGVMGKGIAKDFKRYYPEMFKDYRHLCEIHALDVGKLWIYKTPNKWVLNFPTKKDWRDPSKIDYIESGLQKFVATYKEKNIESISFPQLGVGNGGLDWESEVRPIMEKYLSDLPIDVFIHLYRKGAFTEHIDQIEMKAWLNSHPTSLSFNEVSKDILDLINQNSNSYFKIAENRYELSSLMDEKTGELAAVIFYQQESDKYDPIYMYDFSEVWGILRDNGFVAKVDLTSLSSDSWEKISYLLMQLSYIDRMDSDLLIDQNLSSDPILALKPTSAKQIELDVRVG